MSNVYEIVTEAILKQLEQGTAPWHKPWKTIHGEVPTNLVSGKAYRGINLFLLSHLPYARPLYLTYKQTQELGGQVKRGEHGHKVVFWKVSDRPTTEASEDGGESTTKRSFLLRYYTVFNVAQCEGLDAKIPALPAASPLTPIQSIDSAESIVREWAGKPMIEEKISDRAFYVPALDRITVPSRTQYENPTEFYSTLFHELTHSTGHKSRLNRSTLTELCPFGSTNYSREELVAEMGAAFLCGEAGIENAASLQNSASYIAGWMKKLKADPRCVVTAAAQAQKAADLILNRQ